MNYIILYMYSNEILFSLMFGVDKVNILLGYGLCLCKGGKRYNFLSYVYML